MAVSTHFHRLGRLCLAALLPAMAAAATAAAAPAVEVSDAWIRAPVEGFTSTLGFMTLTASQDVRLVAVKSSAAKHIVLQQMKREGVEVRMVPVDGIALRGGESLSLQLGPGNHQLMLNQLQLPLQPGAKVRMVAIFETGRKGVKASVPFDASVRLPQGYKVQGEDHTH